MTVLLLIVFDVLVGGVLGEAANEDPHLPQPFSLGPASIARALVRASAGSGENWAAGAVPKRRLGGVQGTQPPRLLDEIVNATDTTMTANLLKNRLFGEVLLIIALSIFYTLITALSVADRLLAWKRKRVAMEEACADAGAEGSEDDGEGLSAATPMQVAPKKIKRFP